MASGTLPVTFGEHKEFKGNEVAGAKTRTAGKRIVFLKGRDEIGQRMSKGLFHWVQTLFSSTHVYSR